MSDVTQLRRRSKRATAGYSTRYNSFSCSIQHSCAKRKNEAVQKSNADSKHSNTSEVPETSSVDESTEQSSTVTGLVQSIVPSNDADQEQSGADAGPEQSGTGECLEQSHDDGTIERSSTAVAPELPSGDADQEQSGADAGPEQTYIQLTPVVYFDMVGIEHDIVNSSVLVMPSSDVSADAANVVYLVPDGNGCYSAFSTTQVAANTAVENSTTLEHSQQVVAPNTAEEDPQSLVTTTANSGRPRRGRKRKYLETDNERKLKRNGNKEYVTKDGKSVEPKVFKHDYVCPCSVNEKKSSKMHRTSHNRRPSPLF